VFCFFGQNIKEWPQRGGANGSIRFYPEIKHAANAGEAHTMPACMISMPRPLMN
jgi:hypothetical protein